MLEIQKLDRKTLETARIMYFGNYQLTDIAEKLNIEIDTIRFYVFGEDGFGKNEKCWAYLKKNLNSSSIAVYLKDKISVLEKTAGVALNVINEALTRLDHDMKTDPDFRITIDDMKKLSSIVVDVDKMVRLESGSATELVEHIGLTVAEARKVLAEDDFAQTFDAEYETKDTFSEDALISDVDSLDMPKPWK